MTATPAPAPSRSRHGGGLLERVPRSAQVPADLPPATIAVVQDLAVRAFMALDCAGMARADFFVDKVTGSVYINELNTIPGFTSVSMYPRMWEASGIPYPELLNRLIELAFERHKERSSMATSYR